MTAIFTTSIKIDAEMKERVQRLAATQRCSAHWIMREEIAQDVEREEKRAQFGEAALASCADDQANGLHVAADEADASLGQLELGEDIDSPESHE